MANTRRRKGWLLENLSAGKLGNACLAGIEFMLKRERMLAWPVVLKIDISPLCNLRCTVCVHAKPNGEPYLEKQHFHRNQQMPLASYQRIIEEIRGRSAALSLYYLGDPLVHPELEEMCRIGFAAELNVHVSTNFSFRLSDDRIRRLATCGVTHLTVCVDGLSQEKYSSTRVGGKIEWVLSNLTRLCRYKREARLRYPRIEVQYLTFAHNRDEVEPALRLFEELAVDQVTVVEGSTANWARPQSERHTVHGPKNSKLLPQCLWPHFFMLIKYDGDVIPCCVYRQGEQYSSTDESRAVGNALRTSVREVWNSPSYRQMRRLVSNPAKAAADADADRSFCHGCRKVYDVSPRAAVK